MKLTYDSHLWIESQDVGKDGLRFYKNLIQLHNPEINQSVILKYDKDENYEEVNRLYYTDLFADPENFVSTGFNIKELATN